MSTVSTAAQGMRNGSAQLIERAVDRVAHCVGERRTCVLQLGERHALPKQTKAPNLRKQTHQTTVRLCAPWTNKS